MNSKQISLLRAFLAAGVDFVVVGGVAVNAHGYVRATNDLDLFSAPPRTTRVLPSTLYRILAFRSKAWSPPIS